MPRDKRQARERGGDPQQGQTEFGDHVVAGAFIFFGMSPICGGI